MHQNNIRLIDKLYMVFQVTAVKQNTNFYWHLFIIDVDLLFISV